MSSNGDVALGILMLILIIAMLACIVGGLVAAFSFNVYFGWWAICNAGIMLFAGLIKLLTK